MNKKSKILSLALCGVALLSPLSAYAEDTLLEESTNEYYIIEGHPFHNGLAFMYLSDEFGNKFLGQVDSNFKLIINLLEEYGMDTKWATPDVSGNVSFSVFENEILFYEGGTKVKVIHSNETRILYAENSYFIIEQMPTSGFEITERKYGVMDMQGKILFLEPVENLPFDFDEVEHIYGDLIIENSRYYDLQQVMNINTQEIYELRGIIYDCSDDGRLLVGDVDTNTLWVYDSNCKVLNEIVPDISIDHALCYLNGDVISCCQDYEQAALYKTSGEKIFDTDTAFNKVRPINLCAVKNGYSGLLLQGINSEYNYATMIDPDGNICFEPQECSIGTISDEIATSRKINEFVSANNLFTLQKENQTTYLDTNGNEVLTINSGLSSEAISEDFIFSPDEYCYYDLDGNHYYTVTQ